ncbi:MAG: NYN domain-containing protein, partial [Angustibacter sp.]
TSRAAVASRARLLLDTLLAAGAGLRDELGLAAVEVRPADLVGSAPMRPGAVQAMADGDPERLKELLTLPQAHLIVDGYNVTIGAYGDMPLAQQRARLLSGLSALYARTRAEITCCFDGAQLSGRIAPPAPRGVRVRFSEPGSTADDLIARLVRAEPVGRVVIVISSDQEVAQTARRASAFAVPSAALQALIEPGSR